MKSNRRRPGTRLMAGGLALLAAALLLTGYNLWDERRAASAAARTLEQLAQQTATPDPDNAGRPDYQLAPAMDMPSVPIDGELYIGVLDIPALGLSLPVMDTWSYPKLRRAPCRYAGSAYQGDLVIAAHNYRSHFGLLGNLPAGSRITFTDVDGNRFAYNVAEIQVLPPTAIEEMTDSPWALTLFTCTFGGKTRLAVRCEAAV